MWIIYALVVHLLLLGSIFVIYFRSPVITGLKPQLSLSLEPPAQRLVLIVTDGLRAESFFHGNCSDVPHMRRLLLQQGLVGISHTRVPTESRPGHIALIAGLYEDPSAVTRGWKENPIDFDTLFNRSGHTYAWGATDVLHIFSRVTDNTGGGNRLLIDAYDHELDFSGREKTYALDEWVFERVRMLLRRKGEDLRIERQVVFFLHLLGLDSAGHVHKPGSALFLENLHRTDRGIGEIYEEFERTFPDGRTAYVMTSDHGMTNAGSHGSGDPLETDTPFFLWGAGIAKTAPNQGKTFQAGAESKLPLHELEQAQMAPLMSALLGLAPPMNNFGIMPLGFLNASTEYESHAMYSNALQLLEQFQTLLREHQRGYFTEYLRQFKQLNAKLVADYISSMESNFENRNYDNISTDSYAVMQVALEGIEYYHGYYRNVLLLSTTATFLGWIMYLLQLLFTGQQHKQQSQINAQQTGRFWLGLCGIAIIVVGLLLLQRASLAVTFYLTLPIFIWLLVVQSRHLYRMPLLGKQPIMSVLQLLLLVACAELLVFSFFERKLISLGFLFFAVIRCLRQKSSIYAKDIKMFIWLALVTTLVIFPLLPPSVGFVNTPLLIAGMVVTFVRPYFIKSRIDWRLKFSAGICLVNALLCTYQHSNQLGISIISQTISWIFLIFSFVSIVLNTSTVLKHRVELIFFNLTTLYALLGTSYESLFVIMLASELILALSVQQEASSLPLDVNISHSTHSFLSNSLQESFSLALTILLYTFFSFFGTGNIASISSFDPNIIRCFLSTFSPFVIMALVILKLVIPIVLIISIIFGISKFARTYERPIFICLLLLCDVMGLNFLFLVRNRGSWLEIGTSISHFVIMQVTTLVLLVFTLIAKMFLKLNTATNIEVKVK